MITKLHALIIYFTPRDNYVGHVKSYLSQEVGSMCRT